MMAAAALLMGLVASAPTTASDPRADASRMARKAAAERLGVAEDLVVVERTEAVDWPDSGLGCSVRGEVTQPVLTPGYRVSVRSGDEALVVHVGSGRARICPEGPAHRESFLAAGVKVAGLAREDLAARLGIEPRDVRILSMKPTTWPDRSLGCAGPGAPKDAAATKGFVITLQARDREYTYHADTERALACSKD